MNTSIRKAALLTDVKFEQDLIEMLLYQNVFNMHDLIT